MLGVVAPLLHTLPVALLLVRVTLPPEQKVVGLFVMIDATGAACSVTVTVSVSFAHGAVPKTV